MSHLGDEALRPAGLLAHAHAHVLQVDQANAVGVIADVLSNVQTRVLRPVAVQLHGRSVGIQLAEQHVVGPAAVLHAQEFVAVVVIDEAEALPREELRRAIGLFDERLHLFGLRPEAHAAHADVPRAEDFVHAHGLLRRFEDLGQVVVGVDDLQTRLAGEVGEGLSVHGQARRLDLVIAEVAQAGEDLAQPGRVPGRHVANAVQLKSDFIHFLPLPLLRRPPARGRDCPHIAPDGKRAARR